MFISGAYGNKLWTNHERKSAQARAFQEAQEYILAIPTKAPVCNGIMPPGNSGMMAPPVTE
jgi:hypothetical protein